MSDTEQLKAPSQHRHILWPSLKREAFDTPQCYVPEEYAWTLWEEIKRLKGEQHE